MKRRVLALVTLVACGGPDEEPTDAGADARRDVVHPDDAATDAPSVCGPVDVTGYPADAARAAERAAREQVHDAADERLRAVPRREGHVALQQFADGQSGQACRQCIETQVDRIRAGA